MIIPTFVVRNIAIAFHTGVLDFQLAFVMNEETPFYTVLTRGTDEPRLSPRSGGPPLDSVPRSSAAKTWARCSPPSGRADCPSRPGRTPRFMKVP